MTSDYAAANGDNNGLTGFHTNGAASAGSGLDFTVLGLNSGTSMASQVIVT